MMRNNAHSLMEVTKNEINSLRTNALKQNKKCPPFPPQVWDNIALLSKDYSRSEIVKTLSIAESQFSRAIQKSKIKTPEKPSKKHKFIDVSSSLSTPKVFNNHQDNERKVILEIKTKNGNIISVYE